MHKEFDVKLSNDHFINLVNMFIGDPKSVSNSESVAVYRRRHFSGTWNI